MSVASVVKSQPDLTEVIGDLEKRFKKPVLFRASESRFRIRRLSTGILVLDRILGGGFAIGRSHELYGPFSSAKTLVVLKTIAQAQQRGMLCALCDSEKSFDPEFAAQLGVNVDDLFMIGDLEKGEELIDYVEILIRSGQFGLVAVDSIDALVPKEELEKSAEGNNMGRKGKMTSAMMRKLTAANHGNCTLLMTNQVREQIGIMFGNPEKPVGGRAVGHYASQRLEFRQGEKLTEEMDFKGKRKKVTIGHVVQIRVTKDKTGPNMYRDAAFSYYTARKEIDYYDQIITLGLQDGLIEQVGTRLSVFSSKPLMPKVFIRYLQDNPKIARRLEAIITRNHNPQQELE